MGKLTLISIDTMIFPCPPANVPPGNVQAVTNVRPPPRGDVLLAWKAGQVTTDPPKDFLAIGKRKSSHFDLSLVPLDDDTSRIDKKTTAQQQAFWLKSSPQWHEGQLHSPWKGVRVLGIGGNGIAGLWEKTIPSINGAGPPTVDKVVVKQIGSAYGAANEAKFMLPFKEKPRINHLVKLLAGPFRDVGAGVLGLENIDPLNAVVSRLYLEYCEEGDLQRYLMRLLRLYSADDPIPEDMIWHMFKCLALALATCAHGSEDTGGAGWGKELVHFDIKPENILLQKGDADHPKTHIFKLGDFGSASFVPIMQNEAYIEDKRRRGTRGWDAPEIFDQPRIRPLRYGTPYNVWQVGKCMYSIINRARSFPSTPKAERIWVQFDDMRVGETYGTYMLEAPYSARLRRLVYRCLSRQTGLRPRPRALMAEIQEVLDSFTTNQAINTTIETRSTTVSEPVLAPILAPRAASARAPYGNQIWQASIASL